MVSDPEMIDRVLGVNEKDEILQELLNSFNKEKLHVWRRAQFRCEYCGKKLSDTAAEYFYDSHIDHIVPNGLDGPDEENLALTCKACNFIKRKFDPAGNIPKSSRDVVLLRARDYIVEIRNRNETRRARDLELLQRLDDLERTE